VSLKQKIGLSIGISATLAFVCLTIWTVNIFILLGPTGHGYIDDLPYHLREYILDFNNMLCVILWFSGVLVVINKVFKNI